MSAPKRTKMSLAPLELTQRCINTIRVLAADMVQKANSGHPGAPIGCAPMAMLLWGEVMNYYGAQPKWPSRDRFVLSNGHACALQYSMLHLTGYDVSLDDLKQFRQLGSKTPGHPENHLTPGIEVSTGPLGQGISNAVGLAIAEAHLAAKFNKPGFPIINNYTYVICGDGCLQEGISGEAGSLAGHLGLGKLIVLYDDNHITIDGGTDLSFSEDVLARYAAYGWHVQAVADGNTADLAALRAAVAEAQSVVDRPSIIKVRTVIGLGSKKQGTQEVHGSPLGAEDLAQVKTLYGFDPADAFVVPGEVATFFAEKKAENAAKYAAWEELHRAYAAAYPAEAAELDRVLAGRLPAGYEAALPRFTPKDAAKATRAVSQTVLEKVLPVVTEVIGGSADLTPSTLTRVEANKVDFTSKTPLGRYIRYGVREHAMAALCNGMAAYGGIIPFASTFLNFAGYAMGAIRLSAISHFGVLYIMTHDSIGLGEDGPTHQPVETLMALRATPNTLVLRPADGNEVSGAYKIALEQRHTPSVLALSRQGCVNLEGSGIDKVALGAYVLQEAPAPARVIIAATGSEVQLAVKAAAVLNGEGLATRIVSFPSWELFEQQDLAYRQSVFVPGVPVLSVEAGAVHGWQKYAHASIGMTTFGASAPESKVFAHFGFTVDNVAAKVRKLVAFFGGTPAPALVHEEI